MPANRSETSRNIIAVAANDPLGLLYIYIYIVIYSCWKLVKFQNRFPREVKISPTLLSKPQHAQRVEQRAALFKLVWAAGVTNLLSDQSKDSLMREVTGVQFVLTSKMSNQGQQMNVPAALCLQSSFCHTQVIPCWHGNWSAHLQSFFFCCIGNIQIS